LAATKFSQLMLASKWWWAFLMGMHFIGLSMLMGAIGLLDLRVLGFAKQIPVAPLFGLAPWGVAGFLINLVSGGLAFIGMPIYYSFDPAFLYKMLLIALAGLNLGMFYVTGAHRRCENIGPGEDAPMLAKVIVGTSLILWLGVIVFGRFIQVYAQ
jgi:hypothetical protein